MTRDRTLLAAMTAADIVKRIRPECMNAAEIIGEICDALASREAEIERLRAALEEIAGHMIDSEFASREKRAMAQRALNVERK